MERKREKAREGPGRERNSPCRGLRAAGRAAFSSAHERCDCPTASPSQESSPSGGRRPLYLPGTQGRGEKPSAGYVRYHEEEEEKECVSMCVINTLHTHSLRGHRTHTREDSGALNEAVGSERLNEKKGRSQSVYFDRRERGEEEKEGERQKWRDERKRKRRRGEGRSISGSDIPPLPKTK